MRKKRVSRRIPHIRIVALLPEACTNRSTLFLDDGSLVRNCLRSADIADELFEGAHGGCLAVQCAHHSSSIEDTKQMGAWS
jgi:hypothetical protein